MGIAKKGKRKIVQNTDTYYWWVEDDFDGHTGHSILVTVASEDKKFLVKYYVNQLDAPPFLTVIGKRFSGKTETGGRYKRFLCPHFTEQNIVTPKNIDAIIKWCMDSSNKLIEVDYLGRELSNQE